MAEKREYPPISGHSRDHRYVYAFHMECTDFYKIGVSANPEKRRRMLSAQSPLDIYVVAAVASHNCYRDERLVHEHLAVYRYKNEWFCIPRSWAAGIIDAAIAKAVRDG